MYEDSLTKGYVACIALYLYYNEVKYQMCNRYSYTEQTHNVDNTYIITICNIRQYSLVRQSAISLNCVETKKKLDWLEVVHNWSAAMSKDNIMNSIYYKGDRNYRICLKPIALFIRHNTSNWKQINCNKFHFGLYRYQMMSTHKSCTDGDHISHDKYDFKIGCQNFISRSLLCMEYYIVVSAF